MSLVFRFKAWRIRRNTQRAQKYMHDIGADGTISDGDKVVGLTFPMDSV